MKVLIAATEAVPFAKTGGLADVTGALFREYRKVSGVEAHLVMPLYREVRQKLGLSDSGIQITVPLGPLWHRGKIWRSDPSVHFVECDEFYDRQELYGTPRGDYGDNAGRFAFFSKAVLEYCMASGIEPDIIHCHDWQTALIPLYLKTLYRNDVFLATRSILTIHNLGYQGLFPVSEFPLTGLDWNWFQPEGVEFYGKVNYLKAGLISADILTTVSETYAREILTAEFGYGLEGILRKRAGDVYGVMNGIDTEEWDPGRDLHLPAKYGTADLRGKAICKKKLWEECSLAPEDRGMPLLAFVGRFSEQKGLDLLLDAVDTIVGMGGRMIVLGKGDDHFQRLVLHKAHQHRGKVFVRIGYDEPFAHRIYGGADLYLMPSRYEPCGLGQLIAMRYGTVPIGRRTGGIADTVTDYEPFAERGTGFLFDDYRASSLIDCVRRAFCVYDDRKRWKNLVGRAMEKDGSWRSSAERYIELYTRLLTKTRK